MHTQFGSELGGCPEFLGTRSVGGQSPDQTSLHTIDTASNTPAYEYAAICPPGTCIYLDACAFFFSLVEPREFVDSVESCRAKASASWTPYRTSDSGFSDTLAAGGRQPGCTGLVWWVGCRVFVGAGRWSERGRGGKGTMCKSAWRTSEWIGGVVGWVQLKPFNDTHAIQINTNSLTHAQQHTHTHARTCRQFHPRT